MRQPYLMSAHDIYVKPSALILRLQCHLQDLCATAHTRSLEQMYSEAQDVLQDAQAAPMGTRCCTLHAQGPMSEAEAVRPSITARTQKYAWCAPGAGDMRRSTLNLHLGNQRQVMVTCTASKEMHM